MRRGKLISDVSLAKAIARHTDVKTTTQASAWRSVIGLVTGRTSRAKFANKR
jgi:hypothetical protein